MDRFSSSYQKGDGYVCLWLIGKTDNDRRMLSRIINAMADEIQQRIIEESDWESASDLVAAGAHLIQLRDEMEQAQWDEEDEQI